MKRLTSLSLAAAMALTVLGPAAAMAQPYGGPPGPGDQGPHGPGYQGPPGPGPHPPGPGWHQGWHHGWHRGDHFHGHRHVVHDWHHYGLRPPPRGYEWVRGPSGQFLLIAIGSGIIADILLNSR